MPVRTRRAARARKAENFYDCVLDEVERNSALIALEIEGVDQELAMLRLRLRSMAKELDFGLLLRALDSLRRLVETKYRLTDEQSEAFGAEWPAMRDELKEMFAEVRDDGDAGSN